MFISTVELLSPEQSQCNLSEVSGDAHSYDRYNFYFIVEILAKQRNMLQPNPGQTPLLEVPLCNRKETAEV